MHKSKFLLTFNKSIFKTNKFEKPKLFKKEKKMYLIKIVCKKRGGAF